MPEGFLVVHQQLVEESVGGIEAVAEDDVAKLMRAMEIDVLIDLSGHTEGTRLDILAHRPAPAQVTYLGFPGTLGLPYIDYLISDPRIIPDELEQHYGEKILKLPHCYLPRDDSVVPSPETPKRSDFGLPEEGVVFCSFNHDYKINPPLFKVWMDLLKEVPGSVLWLMKLNDGAHVNLTNAADIAAECVWNPPLSRSAPDGE